jgi:outer membrane protein assembly factor BamB
MGRLGWATVVGFMIAVPAGAGEWPQWRGPHRDGSAPGERLPPNWPKEQPNPLWKVPVGLGYGGPVVSGGQVFLLTRQGEDEACLCLDAATGQTLWRHAYPAAYTPPDKNAGAMPKSTPVVDSERAYFVGITGRFHALDRRTSRVAWAHDFTAEYWGQPKNADGDDPWAPACGVAASPLLDGERLVMPVGGEKGGAIMAFDRRTGRPVWKSLPDRSSYASPLLTELAGVRQLVGFTGTRLVGLAPDSGRLLWDYPVRVKFDQTVLTPVVAGNLVVIGGERADIVRQPTIALRISRSGEKWSVAEAWRNTDLRSYLVSPVAFGGHLLGHSYFRGELVCIDLATGQTAWSKSGFGDFSSIIFADGQLLLLTGGGEFVALEANPSKCVVKARWKVGESPAWAHLALADGRLFIKDKEHLTCIEFPR